MTSNKSMRLTIAAMLVVVQLAWPNLNANGQMAVVRTLSAKTWGRSRLNVGVGANYAQSKNFVYWLSHKDYLDPPLSEEELNKQLDRDPARLFSGNFFAALGLASFWDFAVGLPMFWDGCAGISDFGVGDVELSTKLLYPKPDKPRLFYQAYVVSVAADAAQMSNRGIYPRHAYYYTYDQKSTIFGSNVFSVKGMLAWTFDIGAAVASIPLQIDLNAGAVFPDGSKAICAIGNMALQYSPAEAVSFFVEASSEIRGRAFSRILDIPRSELLFATAGVKIVSPAGVYLHLGTDLGISALLDGERTREPADYVHGDHYRYTTTSTPLLGIQFGFGWNGFLSIQDADKDGIGDSDDRCPKDAEDIDGFEDNDGCPDPDNDKDLIADVNDKCLNDGEDVDGFEDNDGCPDPDNDGDGIADMNDQCPNVGEDFDGFEDRDGCPDADNDKDGIADSLDKCLNDIEDFDGFEDNDGCPDPDNDKDGLLDLKDKCPNEAETFNGVDDEDGCPDEKPAPKVESSMPRQQTLYGVVFRSGKAELDPVSYRYLNPIAEEMLKFPDIEIEVRGHTDALGGYQANLNLSQMRADAVRQYLISRGVSANRIRAVGFGSSNPVADNRTAAGRAQNRRIDIVRIR